MPNYNQEDAKKNIKDYWAGNVSNDDSISSALSKAVDYGKGLLSGSDKKSAMQEAIDKRKAALEGGG